MDTDLEDFIEDKNEESTGNTDTLLDTEYSTLKELIYTFAPTEPYRPKGIFRDTFAEELSYPLLFAGMPRKSNTERIKNVSYSDIVKWECRSMDRRVAKCIPNLFFKLKKLQIQQITNKVSLALRRCKSQGNSYTVDDLIRPGGIDEICKLDEGYRIFKTIRNSPAYFETRKRDVFAMIRQLGLPTWFISLSAADTHWSSLIKTLAYLVDNRLLTDEEIETYTTHIRQN